MPNRRFDGRFLKRWPGLDSSEFASRMNMAGAGFDYISLGLACEELEYCDTSLRVILSVHVALNSMTLVGIEQSKKQNNNTWCLNLKAIRLQPTKTT